MQYNINGWLDKNKDPIQECVVQLMQESKEPLVSVLFKEPEEGTHLLVFQQGFAIMLVEDHRPILCLISSLQLDVFASAACQLCE